MRPRTARLLLVSLLLGIYSTFSVARTATNAIRDAGLLRASVGGAFALAAAAVLGLLLRNPALRRLRTLALLLAEAFAYALVVWPMESPEEKLHFLEYGAVAVLAFLALPLRWSTARRLCGAALFTLAAGWLDEGIQALLPNRYYDLRDVGFNAVAGLMALTCFGLLRWLSQGKAPAETKT